MTRHLRSLHFLTIHWNPSIIAPSTMTSLQTRNSSTGIILFRQRIPCKDFWTILWRNCLHYFSQIVQTRHFTEGIIFQGITTLFPLPILLIPLQIRTGRFTGAALEIWESRILSLVWTPIVFPVAEDRCGEGGVGFPVGKGRGKEDILSFPLTIIWCGAPEMSNRACRGMNLFQSSPLCLSKLFIVSNYVPCSARWSLCDLSTNYPARQ